MTPAELEEQSEVLCGLRFLRELAEAIGFDPDTSHITGIALDCKVQDAPTLTVSLLIHEKQAREILKLVQRYQLVPIDGDVIEERY